MKVTRVATIVTNIILALLAVLCIFITYQNWTTDAAQNIGTILGLAIILGVAKIGQAIILMITRGIDGLPMLFKKH